MESALHQLGELSLGQWFRLAGSIATFALGMAISYVAYQGYRRNGSRPMLFVAVGFVLVLGVQGVLVVAYLALPIAQTTVANVAQLFQVIGLGSILYGLRFSG